MTDEPDEQAALEAAPRASERVIFLTKRVQDWLDRFAEEKITPNYAASLTAVVPMAQKIYIDVLVDTGVITAEDASCKQLEIQALILEDQFNKALLAREADIVRRAHEAGRIQPVQGPRLLIPGGGQRALRNIEEQNRRHRQN